MHDEYRLFQTSFFALNVFDFETFKSSNHQVASSRIDIYSLASPHKPLFSLHTENLCVAKMFRSTMIFGESSTIKNVYPYTVIPEGEKQIKHKEIDEVRSFKDLNPFYVFMFQQLNILEHKTSLATF